MTTKKTSGRGRSRDHRRAESTHTPLGQQLIAALGEALAHARGEKTLKSYEVHVPPASCSPSSSASRKPC